MKFSKRFMKQSSFPGGFWDVKRYDGNKYICFDDLLLRSEPCIIYSFGINDDISFEQTMMEFSRTFKGLITVISIRISSF